LDYVLGLVLLSVFNIEYHKLTFAYMSCCGCKVKVVVAFV